MRLFPHQCVETHGRIRHRASSFEFLVTDEISRHGETLRVARPAVNPVLPGARNCISLCAMRLTIVVPTYKEAANLPHLIDRVAKVRDQHGLDIDMLIMDDDSRDGSVELIAARPENWVQLICRTGNRGLSAAVLDGLRIAKGDVLVCMDADLSHPPESL